MNKSLFAPARSNVIGCDGDCVKHELQIHDGGNSSQDKAKDDDAFPVVVVIAYNDMRAALRAVHALERLRGNFHDKMRYRLIAVPINQLNDPAHFDHLLIEAHSADMIIVSFNGPGDFPDTLKKWVGNCLTQKHGGNSAMVALLSSDERIDATDSPRYQFLENATKSAGLSFFAPNPGKDSRLEYQPLIGQVAVDASPADVTTAA
jgi:hypothetical protein